MWVMLLIIIVAHRRMQVINEISVNNFQGNGTVERP